MKKYLVCFVLLFSVSSSLSAKEKEAHLTTNTIPNRLVKFEKLTSANAKEIKSLMKQTNMETLPQLPQNIDFYRVWYMTEDLHGKLCKASGLVILPQNPQTPPALIGYQHGTSTDKVNVPSRINYEARIMAAAFGTGNYAIAAADYLGLGDSEEMVHPYCHATSLATAGRSLLYATKEMCKQINYPLSEKLFITGYSEGGMGAMALHRLLQEENHPQFQVTAAAPMAGPYDLAQASFGASFQNPSGGSSLYVAYLLLAYNYIYDDIFKNAEEIFHSPFDSFVPNLFDGTQPILVIRHALPSNPFVLVKESFIQALLTSKNNPLVRRLAENCTFQWRPYAPVLLIGAKGDKDVSFVNAEVCQKYMTEQGAQVEIINVGDYLNHETGRAPCHIQARKFFDKFNGSK